MTCKLQVPKMAKTTISVVLKDTNAQFFMRTFQISVGAGARVKLWNISTILILKVPLQNEISSETKTVCVLSLSLSLQRHCFFSGLWGFLNFCYWFIPVSCNDAPAFLGVPVFLTLYFRPVLPLPLQWPTWCSAYSVWTSDLQTTWFLS